MYPNIVENWSAAVQAELRKSVIQMKELQAVTRNSFKSGSGARTEAGRLAGLEIPYYQGMPHGSTALDPISGTTSFERYAAPTMNKMYVGLSFTGFSVEWEHFHELDAAKGLLPETRFTQRDKVMATYMKEMNWYAIGKGNGSLAIVASGGGSGAITDGNSGSITLANDGTALGRSKGSIRLAVSVSSTAGKRVVYESYNPTTDAKTGEFYITAKASATTATFTSIGSSNVAAGDVIVKKGHYKKVPYGLGYHIDSSSRLYQGANTGTDPFLASKGVPGGSAAINPSVIDSAKLSLEVRGNDTGARKKRVCHLTHGHYRTLAAYGYTLRQYNAEAGQANTTYGMPRNYQDEDTEFIQDGDMEDAYIFLRDRSSYFEYRQSEIQKISKGEGTQYIGTNSFGSTEFFDNYGESFNLAWDARGDAGDGPMTQANSSVVISGLAIPSVNQVSEGLSLV